MQTIVGACASHCSAARRSSTAQDKAIVLTFVFPLDCKREQAGVGVDPIKIGVEGADQPVGCFLKIKFSNTQPSHQDNSTQMFRVSDLIAQRIRWEGTIQSQASFSPLGGFIMDCAHSVVSFDNRASTRWTKRWKALSLS
jgi:hypothetical protein